MNYYRITITGETEYSHEHMVGLFGQLIEEVETNSNGIVGIASYTPIDENGDVLERKEE